MGKDNKYIVDREYTELSEPWKECWDQSWQSYCDETNPIGAVVVDSKGKILSAGRNRIFGKPPKDIRQIHNHPFAHAELNALITLDFNEIDPHSCSIYTAVEPCPLCIGAICMSKIKKIHYGARDPWAGSSNLLQATPYMRKKNIKSYWLENSSFETAILSLFTDYALRYQPEKLKKVVDKWMLFNPKTASAAVMVFENGILFEMRNQKLPSEQVLSTLFEFISNNS